MKKTKSIKAELKKHDFRVAIFGSARLKKNDKIYKQVYELAKEVGKYKFDVVTGGGPGLMEAANAGHEEGDKGKKADTIGLVIKLPWESRGNKHLEIKKEFATFSKRLDTFMALSKVAVVMPGGIGTCLELFYAWQLVQVKHIKPIPMILVGKMWEELIKWVKKYPLKKDLVSKKDFDNIYIAKDNKAAMRIILKRYKNFNKRNFIRQKSDKKTKRP